MWTLYTESKLVRVNGTKMPTFEIESICDDGSWESRYFSQDEQASIDQDMFDTLGDEYVSQVLFDCPTYVEDCTFNEETNKWVRNNSEWEDECVRIVNNYDGYNTLNSFR